MLVDAIVGAVRSMVVVGRVVLEVGVQITLGSMLELVEVVLILVTTTVVNDIMGVVLAMRLVVAMPVFVAKGVATQLVSQVSVGTGVVGVGGGRLVLW